MNSATQNDGASNMGDSKVAETILEQMGGAGRLVAMINAKHFVYDGPSLAFKFSNRRGPNYLKIELADNDTYSLTFGRIVKYELRNAEELHGVYADQLREIFESKTGLYLSL